MKYFIKSNVNYFFLLLFTVGTTTLKITACGLVHIIFLLEALVRDFWVVKRPGHVLHSAPMQSEIREVRPLVQDHAASW